MRLAIVSRSYSTVDLPNLQRAITTLAKGRDIALEAVGYTGTFAFQNDLRTLLSHTRMGDVLVGPVQYKNVQIGSSEFLSCLENGLFLLHDRVRTVIHVRSNEMTGSLDLEIMSSEGDGADLIEEIAKQVVKQNVYRGKVISLESSCGRGRTQEVTIRFQDPPQISREDIILPERILKLIERNTIGFVKQADRLRESGRSTKRGLLLYGPPGTGKTFTAKWLAYSQPGLTVIVLSGEQLALIREGCQLARMLAPSLVIMEDVDLVATHRDEQMSPSSQVTLHQILNELDGMPSNTDVTFLLTTNRPEAIEPALAGRPGRIDQAIEYPLPDAECRRKLFDLYGQGLAMEVDDIEDFVARTEGASPAFIQELLRKSALIASEKSDRNPIPVSDAEIREALQELLFEGGDLTRQLLGFSGEKPSGFQVDG